MKNSLGLDIDEVILLQASLETFLESKNAVVHGIQIREPLRTELIESSLAKFENLSLMTYFTKQEISIMVLSLHHIINCNRISKSNELNEDEVFSTTEKLSALAGADKMHLN